MPTMGLPGGKNEVAPAVATALPVIFIHVLIEAA